MLSFFHKQLVAVIAFLFFFSPMYAKSKGSHFKQFKCSKHGQYLGYPRDYYRSVTVDEKDALRFIVLSLSNKQLLTIAKLRPDLETAGNIIDELHPLKFLYTVFSDEEMKIAVRNIRTRIWLWSNFINGLKQSLTTESSIGNITNEQVHDFANSLSVDYQLVKREIEQKQWEGLVNLLIHLVPRDGSSQRYD